MQLSNHGLNGSIQPGRSPASYSWRTYSSDSAHPISASIAPMHLQQSPPVLPDSGSSGLSSRHAQIVQCCAFMLFVIISFRDVHHSLSHATPKGSNRPRAVIGYLRIQRALDVNVFVRTSVDNRSTLPISPAKARRSSGVCWVRVIGPETNEKAAVTPCE